MLGYGKEFNGCSTLLAYLMLLSVTISIIESLSSGRSLTHCSGGNAVEDKPYLKVECFLHPDRIFQEDTVHTVMIVSVQSCWSKYQGDKETGLLILPDRSV